MKKKFFYSHIVETSSISLSLADMDVTPQERKHLIQLSQANLHHAIIDAVLSHLSDEDKKTFLHHLHEDNHEKIWNLLERKITAIDEKIIGVADTVIKQLHADIQQAKKHA